MRQVIGYGIIILSALPFVVIRFFNIDMTQTRLVVNYWYLLLLCFAGIIIGGLILRKD